MKNLIDLKKGYFIYNDENCAIYELSVNCKNAKQNNIHWIITKDEKLLMIRKDIESLYD